jgi:hypothetical protein
VKIEMELKVVFGTFRPIVNRSVLCTKRGTARGAEKRAGGAGNAGPRASASDPVQQAPADAFNSWPP